MLFQLQKPGISLFFLHEAVRAGIVHILQMETKAQRGDFPLNKPEQELAYSHPDTCTREPPIIQLLQH